MLACAYSYAYTYGIFVKNTEHGTGGRKARHDSILVENYCPEKKQSTHSHKQKKNLTKHHDNQHNICSTPNKQQSKHTHRGKNNLTKHHDNQHNTCSISSCHPFPLDSFLPASQPKLPSPYSLLQFPLSKFPLRMFFCRRRFFHR